MLVTRLDKVKGQARVQEFLGAIPSQNIFPLQTPLGNQKTRKKEKKQINKRPIGPITHLRHIDP
jgi:hypothetical protein